MRVMGLIASLTTYCLLNPLTIGLITGRVTDRPFELIPVFGPRHEAWMREQAQRDVAVVPRCRVSVTDWVAVAAWPVVIVVVLVVAANEIVANAGLDRQEEAR